MQRAPEPELMDEAMQAKAYAEADFNLPHNKFVDLLEQQFAKDLQQGCLLDLGCGPADISIRLAQRFPGLTIHGVDGAAAMLKHGQHAINKAGLANRITLVHAYLPTDKLPQQSYNAVLSNSLLHHLKTPETLWQSIKQFSQVNAPVFIMDLLRPASTQAAKTIVNEQSANEPEILRNDFYNSLLAAYSVEEIKQQLVAAQLNQLNVAKTDESHWLVSGYLPKV